METTRAAYRRGIKDGVRVALLSVTVMGLCVLLGMGL